MDLLIVTGGSRGLGAAMLRQWPGTDPVRRVVVARGAPAEAVNGPDDAPTSTVIVEQMDLADPSTWHVLGHRLQEHLGAHEWGRIAFVHAAATTEPIGFAGEVDGAGYASQSILNAAAPLAVGDEFLRAVATTSASYDEAVLVQVTSGAARGSYAGVSAYCAGKAAVDHWVRVVGDEQRRRGSRTRVVAIAPGVVATAMQDVLRTADEEDLPSVGRFHELHDQGRLVDPDAAARSVWQLALAPATANGAVLDVREVGDV